MKIIIWIIVFVIALIIGLLISKVKVTVHYSHSGNNDRLIILMKAAYGLYKKKIDIPVIKMGEDSAEIVMKEQMESKSRTEGKGTKRITIESLLNSFQDTKAIVKHVIDAYPIMRHFLKRVRILEFTWHSNIGTGDAALTGKITGAAWGAKGLAQAVMDRYTSVDCVPSIHVTPHFNSKLSMTDLHCILTVRIGHAMVTAIKLIRHWKGGRVHLPSPFAKHSDQSNKSL